MLKRELGLVADLIKGDHGIFEVRADDAVIFSKARECGGRFPTPEQIVKILRARP